MVDMEMLEQTIKDAVNDSGGIKAVDLTLKVMRQLHPISYSARDFLLCCDRLVSQGDLIELEYTVPNVHYRLKSMYFPKGTSFYFGNTTQVETGFNPDDTTKET